MIFSWLLLESSRAEGGSCLLKNYQSNALNYKSNHDLRRKMPNILRFALTFAIGLFFLIQPSQASTTSDLSDDFLSPEIPSNLSLTIDEFEGMKKQLPQLQRQFDLFSWQEFIALNWPTVKDGLPARDISDSGEPAWAESFVQSTDVFLSDGSQPNVSFKDGIKNLSSKAPHCPGNLDGTRELYLTSSVTHNSFDNPDEVNQAFTSPLWDQNGHEVRYEILLNKDEYNYIVKNGLYNIDGQIEFFQNREYVNFPAGKGDQVGAIEIKLAWKNLQEAGPEEAARYYQEYVLLPELDADGEPKVGPDGNFASCRSQLVGLVGMHIAHKTALSPQWVWSTFEQVDNLVTNDLEIVDGNALHPSFTDTSPSGQILPVNVPPIYRDADGKPCNSSEDPKNCQKRTQVSRPIPIPGSKVELNHQVQQLLAKDNSPLQYYMLIDTQWPTAPFPETDKRPACTGADPTDPYCAVTGSANPKYLPEAITRKSTGSPAPVYLTNSIMETYFQSGNQAAQLQENGFPQDKTLVFGTESCMGCHFSAGIATGVIRQPYGDTEVIRSSDATADFSWLLAQKAQWHDKAAFLDKYLK